VQNCRNVNAQTVVFYIGYTFHWARTLCCIFFLEHLGLSCYILECWCSRGETCHPICHESPISSWTPISSSVLSLEGNVWSQTLPQLYLSSQVKLWGFCVILMASWWYGDSRFGCWLQSLSKLMPCFVSVECSAVADHWFSILVSDMFGNSGGYVAACLVNVQLSAWEGDLVSTWFFGGICQLWWTWCGMLFY
jgi:hypothetical protein